MKKQSALVAAMAAVGLIGCESETAREPAEAAPAEKSEPAAETPGSIIRPEVIAEKAVEVPTPPLETTIPFAEGGFQLSAEAESALASVLASDQLSEGWPVVLRGHTDSVGHDEANLRASRRRAEAVADWLTENGVSEDRIEIIAIGEQRPIAPNALPDGSPDEAGRARNRRVTVTIAPRSSEGRIEEAPSEPPAAPEG